ncbi:MAG TPA: endolytic transglycosylase MltG [Candidatus Saccharimonadales bacterium]
MRRVPRRLIIVGIALLVLLVGAVVVVRHAYNQNLKPVSKSQETKIVNIPTGSSVKEISKLLADQKLIHNTWVFEWYVHSKQLGNKLQAGTYALSPSESLPQIADTLTQGKVTTRLVTILPGRRIDQVRADLINDGFSVAAVDAALQPDQYRDLPIMSFVPKGTKTLEGLLHPDSYQRIESTSPSSIIRQSLQDMGSRITADVQSAFAARGLNVYEGLALASVVEREVSKQEDRRMVAQVFYSRLQQGISLGSDPTAFYGAVLAGKTPSVKYDSPYNTRLYRGLPPGPISTISDGALQATMTPAATDALYFVSGDDGTTHFSKTLEEHERKTEQYCHELCQ